MQTIREKYYNITLPYPNIIGETKLMTIHKQLARTVVIHLAKKKKIDCHYVFLLSIFSQQHEEVYHITFHSEILS